MFHRMAYDCTATFIRKGWGGEINCTTEIHLTVFKNYVPNSQKTQKASITKANQLMLFKEIFFFFFRILWNTLLGKMWFSVSTKATSSRDSSVGIATRYGNQFPVGGKIFRTRPDRYGGPPSLLYNGYRVFPGSNTAGTWCWPPTPTLSAEVLNWVELYLYPP